MASGLAKRFGSNKLLADFDGAPLLCRAFAATEGLHRIVVTRSAEVKALCEERGGRIFMNPGSLSIPKENSPHGYMTLEDGLFLWKDVDGAEYKSFSLA